MKHSILPRLIILVFVLHLSFDAGPMEAIQGGPDLDFTDLSIEELVDLEVTSVSRKPQKASHAAAAIFVITAEDIYRLGITTIPEALRMVPGLQVCRITSSAYAVSSRGFSSRYANKLLIQIDGRTIYTPTFSGVFWEIQDMFIDDIDRIEVIRGPGASLWGANAVNGIINIISKNAEDSQGGIVYGGEGYKDISHYGIRYGGKIGNKGYYKFYTKFSDYDETEGRGNEKTFDSQKRIQAGAQADMNLANGTAVQAHMNIFSTKTGEHSVFPSIAPPDYREELRLENNNYGGNFLVKGTYTISPSSDLTFQIYYDRFEIELIRSAYINDIVDMDLQHRFELAERHEIIWGIGNRFNKDDYDFDDSNNIDFDPQHHQYNTFSFFIHDEIDLKPDSLVLVMGSKFEHNHFTGFEVQPNIRMLWSPHENHKLWAAVSRAVRTPSRSENHVDIDTAIVPPTVSGDPPLIFHLYGNRNILSEELTAYEAGYRVKISSAVNIDTALFYNVYKNLSGFYLGDYRPDTHIQEILVGNLSEGKTYGIESAMVIQVLDWWRLQCAYTFFKMDTMNDESELSVYSANNSDSPPAHQFSLRSYMDLPWNVKANLFLWYMDDIQANRVDGYTELDATLIWSPHKNTSISISGCNLLKSRHLEYLEETLWDVTNYIQRSIFVKATFNF